ncbi:MAG TPA: tetratricopeptide repeat protein [Candidatus Binataceae bacterium]
MLIGALAVSGCAMPDNQQQAGDEDLRNTVAADRQQINALQDQVNRLNDHIAEMEHNGDADSGSSADAQKLAALEQEVQALKGGAASTTPGAPPAPGAPGAAASAPAPGGPTDANGNPLNPPPGTTVAPNAPAGPGAPVVAGAPPSGAPDMAGPGTPPPANAGNPPPDNDANENDSDNDSDNGSQVASNAPPPAAAPPAAPSPPMVNGAPSWRAALNQELISAQSINDPAAKTYRAGLVAMKAGKYPNAIGVFQGLQRKYPKSPLSEPAEYFSASALYELGKFDQSILQFNDLVMRFPRGRFASASLLSEANAFIKMNDRIDARLTLQKLISDHPDAPEAAVAQSMMNSLANG